MQHAAQARLTGKLRRYRPGHPPARYIALDGARGGLWDCHDARATEAMSILPHFELSAESHDEHTHVIHVKGEIHVSTVKDFAQRLDEAMGRAAAAIVLDLTEVEFIDSTGLSVLLNGLRSVTRRGGRLALAISNPTVLRLFEITRLDATFDIEPTVQDALRRAQAPEY
jgi:anti-sigma B factor antagonist